MTMENKGYNSLSILFIWFKIMQFAALQYVMQIA